MEKINKERNILTCAEPLLRKLYGDFDIVPEQLDKPDAAIKRKSCDKKIGIEITSVDKENIQEYINNEKITREITSQQISDLLSNGKYSSRPVKKVSIPFHNDYIFDGTYKKAEKYQSYIDSGNYEEMIILAFSAYLSTDHKFFNDYHKPWTNFLLSDKKFPFDKVIFVCERTGHSVVIYDKKSPLQNSPSRDTEKELGETISHSSILPVGKKINISGLFKEEPHVSQSKKKRRK